MTVAECAVVYEGSALPAVSNVQCQLRWSCQQKTRDCCNHWLEDNQCLVVFFYKPTPYLSWFVNSEGSVMRSKLFF